MVVTPCQKQGHSARTRERASSPCSTLSNGPPTECIFGEAIVDTGASTSLLSQEFGQYLSQTKQSTACIQGFEGRTEIKGGIRGIGHLYIIGDDNQQSGFQLSTNFDTIENLNSNLFSVSSLYEDHNFSIMLRNKLHRGGRCEMRRETSMGDYRQFRFSTTRNHRHSRSNSSLEEIERKY